MEIVQIEKDGSKYPYKTEYDYLKVLMESPEINQHMFQQLVQGEAHKGESNSFQLLSTLRDALLISEARIKTLENELSNIDKKYVEKINHLEEKVLNNEYEKDNYTSAYKKVLEDLENQSNDNKYIFEINQMKHDIHEKDSENTLLKDQISNLILQNSIGKLQLKNEFETKNLESQVLMKQNVKNQVASEYSELFNEYLNLKKEVTIQSGINLGMMVNSKRQNKMMSHSKFNEEMQVSIDSDTVQKLITAKKEIKRLNLELISKNTEINQLSMKHSDIMTEKECKITELQNKINELIKTAQENKHCESEIWNFLLKYNRQSSKFPQQDINSNFNDHLNNASTSSSSSITSHQHSSIGKEEFLVNIIKKAIKKWPSKFGVRRSDIMGLSTSSCSSLYSQLNEGSTGSLLSETSTTLNSSIIDDTSICDDSKSWVDDPMIVMSKSHLNQYQIIPEISKFKSTSKFRKINR